MAGETTGTAAAPQAPVALTAADVMSRALITVTGDESPVMAWELMRRAQVHHLPVIDGNGRVLGVLSREDVAAEWTGGPAGQSRRPVRDLLATTARPRVLAGTPLAEVAAHMIDGDCTAVPVVEPLGRLIGLVTTTDVLCAVAGRLPRHGGAGQNIAGLFRIEPVLPGDPEDVNGG